MYYFRKKIAKSILSTIQGQTTFRCVKSSNIKKLNLPLGLTFFQTISEGKKKHYKRQKVLTRCFLLLSFIRAFLNNVINTSIMMVYL